MCCLSWIGVTNFAVYAQEAVLAAARPAVLTTLHADIKQAVIVYKTFATDFKATLSAWERVDENSWYPVFENLEAVSGKNGFAPQGEKMEGDGRTPSGIFDLSYAFGYDASVQTKLDYRQAMDNDFWVDDPESLLYNQWVRGTPPAKSYERMKRDDDLYKYGIVIDYNSNPVIPNYGSAIFLHIWRGPDQPTSGCVALAEENVLKLLQWLSKAANPVIVIGYDL